MRSSGTAAQSALSRRARRVLRRSARRVLRAQDPSFGRGVLGPAGRGRLQRGAALLLVVSCVVVLSSLSWQRLADRRVAVDDADRASAVQQRDLETDLRTTLTSPRRADGLGQDDPARRAGPPAAARRAAEPAGMSGTMLAAASTLAFVAVGLLLHRRILRWWAPPAGAAPDGASPSEMAELGGRPTGEDLAHPGEDDPAAPAPATEADPAGPGEEDAHGPAGESEVPVHPAGEPESQDHPAGDWEAHAAPAGELASPGDPATAEPVAVGPVDGPARADGGVLVAPDASPTTGTRSVLAATDLAAEAQSGALTASPQEYRVTLYDRTTADPVAYRAPARLQWGDHDVDCTTVRLSLDKVTCVYPATEPAAPPAGLPARIAVELVGAVVPLLVRVRWSRVDGDVVRVGLQFEQMTPEDRALLARTLQEAPAGS